MLISHPTHASFSLLPTHLGWFKPVQSILNWLRPVQAHSLPIHPSGQAWRRAVQTSGPNTSQLNKSTVVTLPSTPFAVPLTEPMRMDAAQHSNRHAPGQTAKPLRVLSVLESGRGTKAIQRHARLRISGRMADVCAELDRLAAQEALQGC